MAKGINPNEEKKKNRVKGITLLEIHNQYKKTAQNRLARGTLVNYQDFIDNQFADWTLLSIRKITADMIIKQHQKITEESGSYAANASMQYLRALYNFAQIEDESLHNPVQILSKKKLWNPTKRRDSFIQDHELAAWYRAVMNLQNQTMKDILRFLLFTGLRKMEAFRLRWENVDLEGRTFLIPHTKNGTPLRLPISDFLYDLLSARKKNAGDSPWVFAGNGKEGHLTEPDKAIQQVINESGIKFMLHDLRRTFITNAEKLEISSYALKKLVNHKVNDVTAGYIIATHQRLKVPMQRITDELLMLIKQEKKPI